MVIADVHLVVVECLVQRAEDQLIWDVLPRRYGTQVLQFVPEVPELLADESLVQPDRLGKEGWVGGDDLQAGKPPPLGMNHLGVFE